MYYGLNSAGIQPFLELNGERHKTLVHLVGWLVIALKLPKNYAGQLADFSAFLDDATIGRR